ncbi:accessory Sec system S-layer assembly protein [Virgibacillus sp. DJP39]|uniref:accessory Sec system S-layer assembly protein n=1 Tax=Virgibacillus sp. DJP39 TaxID=3409790 RepID=UPI003BB7FBE3
MFGSKRQKKAEKESSVNAEEIIGSEDANQGEAMIDTELSLLPNWNIPNEEKYVYAYHNSESPKLKVNQISLYPIEINKQKNNSLVATALIKNTLKKSIHFEKTTILLLGESKQVIAKKEFDLKQLGTLPPTSARPWRFLFSPNDISSGVDTDLNAWSLAFEIKRKHQLDLAESWEKSIAENTKSSLQKIVESAAPLKPGEVNFMGLEAKQKENKDLVVTILIRNGAEKNITLEQAPFGLKDASGEEIAKGSFKLEDFTVKANTSKPWTFIFPASVITKEEIDLSKWQVYPIQ